MVPFNGAAPITAQRLEPNRVRFTYSDVWTGGFRVDWDNKAHGGTFPTAQELATKGPEIAVYMDKPFSGGFPYGPTLADAWPYKGSTDFNLPARMRAGEDIRPILRQRRFAGAGWVRSLAGGFPFWHDQYYLTMDELRQYWGICLSEGMRVFQCVFAGTRVVPGASDQGWQLNYWENVKQTAAPYGEHIALQLANEWNHGSQSINPQAFSPTSANLCDHGPGLTDAHPVEPFWSIVSWHARRECFENDVPSAKAINNVNAYGFEHQPYPRAQHWLCGEMAKPEDYGFNPAYAYDLGRSCGATGGGNFHCGQGVASTPWPSNVESCARAFYEGIESVS
jgi:hypothetical protein